MMLLRGEVIPGPRPHSAAVSIPTAAGRVEHLSIEAKFIVRKGDAAYLPVWVVGKDERNKVVLVELPAEADSGANRVWVRTAQVTFEPDEVPA